MHYRIISYTYRIMLLLVLFLYSILTVEAQSRAALQKDVENLSGRFAIAEKKIGSLLQYYSDVVSGSTRHVSFFSTQNVGLWMLWVLLLFFILLLLAVRRDIQREQISKPLKLAKKSSKKLPDKLDKELSLVKEPRIVKIRVRKITKK